MLFLAAGHSIGELRNSPAYHDYERMQGSLALERERKHFTEQMGTMDFLPAETRSGLNAGSLRWTIEVERARTSAMFLK